MKTALCVAALLALASTNVAADPNWKVEFAGDAGNSSCFVSGDGSGFTQIHMFQTGDQGATAVQFAGYLPACWPGAVWLSDTLAENWLSIGNTQHAEYGLSIAFAVCREMPIYLGTINVMGAPASPCCKYSVVKPNAMNGWPGDAPAVAVVCPQDPNDVNQWLQFPAAGGHVTLNAQPGCQCALPLATQETTWGKVKSLYK